MGFWRHFFNKYQYIFLYMGFLLGTAIYFICLNAIVDMYGVTAGIILAVATAGLLLSGILIDEYKQYMQGR